MKRTLRLHHKLLLVLFGGVLALTITEIVLRLSLADDHRLRFNMDTPATSGRWVNYPFLPYIGRPNANYTFYNPRAQLEEHIHTNSWGFRAHEFPATKSAQDYFVLCFGGSTTYGYSASNDKTWPEQLERLLQERYPQRHVTVFNLGIDMATSVFSVVDLALVGVHLHPDLVIDYDGINDLNIIGTRNFRTDHAHIFHDLDADRAWRGVERSLPRWMLKSYAIASLAGASDMLFRLNDLAKVASNPREEDPDRLRGIEATLENLRTIHSMAGVAKAEAIFSTVQLRDGENPLGIRFNEALREFFAANGFRYVDQERLIPDHDATINVDEVHFTEKGDGMMAANYFRYIVENGLVGD